MMRIAYTQSEDFWVVPVPHRLTRYGRCQRSPNAARLATRAWLAAQSEAFGQDCSS